MRRIVLVTILVAGLAAVAPGCGGGGDKTFDESGFDFTFKYPADFEQATQVRTRAQAGGSAVERKAIGLDEDNLIIVTRFDLRVAVTESNLGRIKEELDGVVSQVAGTALSGRRTQAGGLPGYEYEFTVSRPANGRSRLVALFDGRREYTLNCQSTPSKRGELNEACHKALDTLEPK